MSFPYYKKFSNNTEFYKVTSPTTMLSAFLTVGNARILLCKNAGVIENTLSGPGITDATAEEFDKAYTSSLKQIEICGCMDHLKTPQLQTAY